MKRQADWGWQKELWTSWDEGGFIFCDGIGVQWNNFHADNYEVCYFNRGTDAPWQEIDRIVRRSLAGGAGEFIATP